jgi:hypothetical protein
MEYITKNFHDLFNALPSMNCAYQKPSICPHCGISCDAYHIQQFEYSYSKNNTIFVFLVLQCTSCRKLFTTTYHIKDNHSELLGITPKCISSFHDSTIEEISPRFIEMYNQSLHAKDNNNLNLAAIGYRAALEILVKDYAIKELQKSPEEVIKKSLFSAISEYLSAENLIKTADVIRILGNDHTHYERKYPELDFNLLQAYMEIFINLVKTQLLIAHPPVARQQQ